MRRGKLFIGITLAAAILGMVCTAFAASRARTKAVSIAALQRLKPPLPLDLVERTFGPAVGQPGPRVTYPSAEHKGMSLWFWYWCPQRPGPVPRSEIIVECVILATTVTEKQQRVVWPLGSIDRTPEELIRRVNEHYQRRK